MLCTSGLVGDVIVLMFSYNGFNWPESKLTRLYIMFRPFPQVAAPGAKFDVSDNVLF